MWISRLLKGFRRQETETEKRIGLGDVEWLKGSTVETAFLFASQMEYFSLAVTALNASGARREGCVLNRGDRLVDKWTIPPGAVAYVGYHMAGVDPNSSQSMPENKPGYVFAYASNPAYAGLVLALCFDILHSSKKPSASRKRNDAILMLGVACAAECGERLTQEASINITQEFFAWASQGDPQVIDVRLFDTLKAAAETLKAHWKTGEDGYARFVQTLAMLATFCIADGEISEKVWSTTALIAGGIMGVSKAAYEKAIDELATFLNR